LARVPHQNHLTSHNNRVEASFLLEVEVIQGITAVPMIVADPSLVRKRLR
jgi:hypothetical protein